jgi:GH24 family phage-related lysozyme (muramidase)
MLLKSTGRKRSAETQLREVKRDLKLVRSSIAQLRQELEQRRRFGAQMANFCFNLGQENSTEGQKLGTHVQALLRDMCVNWDAIKEQP